jgi:hypothetical protein
MLPLELMGKKDAKQQALLLLQTKVSELKSNQNNRLNR